jgi:uncharacterized membrane protein (UPF0127 family)
MMYMTSPTRFSRQFRHHAWRMALVSQVLLLAACAVQPANWVELKGARYEVELALDDASRMRGLMFRDSMPANHGMLFVFPHQEPQAFWMKNTKIPLDILYFDRDLRFVSVSARTPPCTSSYCPSYPSEGPAQYVLELNAGHVEKLGVKRGDELVLSPDIRAKLDLH